MVKKAHDGDNYVGYYGGTLISDSVARHEIPPQAKDKAELVLSSSATVDHYVTSYRPDTKLYALRYPNCSATRIYQNPICDRTWL